MTGRATGFRSRDSRPVYPVETTGKVPVVFIAKMKVPVVLKTTRFTDFKANGSASTILFFLKAKCNTARRSSLQ